MGTQTSYSFCDMHVCIHTDLWVYIGSGFSTTISYIVCYTHVFSCTSVCAVVRGRSEYATFASNEMAGVASGRGFKVVEYAELGLVAIAELVVGGKMTSSLITLAGDREKQGITTHILINTMRK